MTAEERAYIYASTQKPTKLQVGEIVKHYNNGYNQALQDFLEKACKWFESNLIDKEIVSMGIWHKFTAKDIEQFKNYMQDEEM